MMIARTDLQRGPAHYAPALLIWIATLAGLGLSVVSLLKICGACSVTGQYRIFGQSFGWLGIAFFAVVTVAVALRRRFPAIGWLPALLLFAAAGAEMRFIWIQKYEIGQWCPVCLWLASTVFVNCASLTWERLRSFSAQGVRMKTRFFYFLAVAACFAVGLGTAILGISKEADSAELDLFLGKSSSPTTVYFVSDWFCPACRKAEPAIEAMVPELARTVKVGFVDFPIHKETINYTPYNIQFLVHEKGKYLQLRRVLSNLSQRSKAPSEADVQAAVAQLGVKLRPVNNNDTLFGLQSNLMVYRGYNVTSTPTAVITNEKTKKTKLLVGDRDITLPSIKAAIAEVAQ